MRLSLLFEDTCGSIKCCMLLVVFRSVGELCGGGSIRRRFCGTGGQIGGTGYKYFESGVDVVVSWMPMGWLNGYA